MRQQRAGFFHAEGQVVGPDLGKLSGEPVPLQRQERVPPGPDHQVQARAGVPQQVGEPIEDGRTREQMEVVKDHHHGRILSGQHRSEPQQEGVIDGVAAWPGRDTRYGDAGLPQGRRDV